MIRRKSSQYHLPNWWNLSSSPKVNLRCKYHKTCTAQMTTMQTRSPWFYTSESDVAIGKPAICFPWSVSLILLIYLWCSGRSRRRLQSHRRDRLWCGRTADTTYKPCPRRTTCRRTRSQLRRAYRTPRRIRRRNSSGTGTSDRTLWSRCSGFGDTLVEWDMKREKNQWRFCRLLTEEKWRRFMSSHSKSSLVNQWSFFETKGKKKRR